MGSGTSSELQEKTNKHLVVIIGGGYAGALTANLLKKAGVPFKLINQTEFFHHCNAALRATVKPESWGPMVVISLREAFGEDFIQAKATSIDSDKNLVTLDNGQELEFTHCVIAVGSLGPVPARTEQAKKIAVVGGGPVGVELVGEIRDVYADVDITLISARDTLVSDRFSEKFQTSIKAIMDIMQIKVTVGKALNLNDLELNVVKEQIVQLDNEDSLETDLVISCIGLPPNKDSISQLMAGKLDENNRIKVDEFLKVEGFSNIFAIGDCCNTSEDKMAAHAQFHAKNVAANILLEACGKPMKAYKQVFDGMLITVGSRAGAGSINGWYIPQFLVVWYKSDLVTKHVWEDLGLEPPKM